MDNSSQTTIISETTQSEIDRSGASLESAAGPSASEQTEAEDAEETISTTRSFDGTSDSDLDGGLANEFEQFLMTDFREGFPDDDDAIRDDNGREELRAISDAAGQNLQTATIGTNTTYDMATGRPWVQRSDILNVSRTEASPIRLVPSDELMADVVGESDESGRSDEGGQDAIDSDGHRHDISNLHMLRQMQVTAEEYQRGMDLQGINFDRLPLTRQQYREERSQRYRNFRNLSPEVVADVIPSDADTFKPVGDGNFFKFQYSRMMERCAITHFQLRHLLCASSKNDLFFPYHSTIRHWNPISKRGRTIADLSRLNSSVQTSNFFRITSMSANADALVCGGFFGELAYQPLVSSNDCKDGLTPSICKLSPDPNGITNFVEMAEARSGSKIAVAANNDAAVRTVDLKTMTISHTLSMPWAVNCSRQSPTSGILAVAGDCRDTHLVDTESDEVVAILQGHRDFSFSLAWSPCGNMLATGNQDKTTKIYDIRFPSRYLSSISTNIGAVRSLQFSKDGLFLMMAEPADFVHILDVANDFARAQTIDMFGDIAGCAFTPDDEYLYIANADEVYGALIEFRRRHAIDSWSMTW